VDDGEDNAELYKEYNRSRSQRRESPEQWKERKLKHELEVECMEAFDLADDDDVGFARKATVEEYLSKLADVHPIVQEFLDVVYAIESNLLNRDDYHDLVQEWCHGIQRGDNDYQMMMEDQKLLEDEQAREREEMRLAEERREQKEREAEERRQAELEAWQSREVTRPDMVFDLEQAFHFCDYEDEGIVEMAPLLLKVDVIRGLRPLCDDLFHYLTSLEIDEISRTQYCDIVKKWASEELPDQVVAKMRRLAEEQRLEEIRAEEERVAYEEALVKEEEAQAYARALREETYEREQALREEERQAGAERTNRNKDQMRDRYNDEVFARAESLSPKGKKAVPRSELRPQIMDVFETCDEERTGFCTVNDLAQELTVRLVGKHSTVVEFMEKIEGAGTILIQREQYEEYLDAWVGEEAGEEGIGLFQDDADENADENADETIEEAMARQEAEKRAAEGYEYVKDSSRIRDAHYDDLLQAFTDLDEGAGIVPRLDLRVRIDFYVSLGFPEAHALSDRIRNLSAIMVEREEYETYLLEFLETLTYSETYTVSYVTRSKRERARHFEDLIAVYDEVDTEATELAPRLDLRMKVDEYITQGPYREVQSVSDSVRAMDAIIVEKDEYVQIVEKFVDTLEYDDFYEEDAVEQTMLASSMGV